MKQHVREAKEREIFTCGPLGYMEAVKSLLRGATFDFAPYHQESFDIAALGENR